MMETQGVKFGADALGKLKMVLQCVVLVAVLAVLWLRTLGLPDSAVRALHGTQIGLIYAMLVATVVSGLQYVVKAVRHWQKPAPGTGPSTEAPGD
jgi:CDP-diacylglycerol--glycerol-3-phosphate 3-phosphatidyltransferase